MENNIKIILPSTSGVSNKIVLTIRGYVAALLITSGRKNCASMSRETGIEYSELYGFLTTAKKSIGVMESHLLKAAQQLGADDPSACITIDFTQLEKFYAQLIGGLGYDHNGNSKRSEKGLSIGVIAISGKRKTIPFDFRSWVQKKYAPGVYVKKNDLMKELVRDIKKIIKFKFLLADSAFSSEDFIKFLIAEGIQFIMGKAASRCIVTKNGVSAQIRYHRSARLRRNERARITEASYKGISLFFITHKRRAKNGSWETVFYVSNVKMTAKEYLKWYKERFVIEKFFRTAKQSLGLKQCQAIAAEKQRAHVLANFIAYAALEQEKVDKQKQCPEDVLHLLRNRASVSALHYFTGSARA